MFKKKRNFKKKQKLDKSLKYKLYVLPFAIELKNMDLNFHRNFYDLLRIILHYLQSYEIAMI